MRAAEQVALAGRALLKAQQPAQQPALRSYSGKLKRDVRGAPNSISCICNGRGLERLEGRGGHSAVMVIQCVCGQDRCL